MQQLEASRSTGDMIIYSPKLPSTHLAVLQAIRTNIVHLAVGVSLLGDNEEYPKKAEG